MFDHRKDTWGSRIMFDHRKDTWGSRIMLLSDLETMSASQLKSCLSSWDEDSVVRFLFVGPKTGCNRAPNTATNSRDCLVFLGF